MTSGRLSRSTLRGSLSAVAIALPCLAGAQTAETVSAATFGRDPARYVGRPVRVPKVGCFSSSPDAGYRCTTYGGVYLLPGAVAPASVKATIDGECGGIVESEDDPTCLFDAVFTPTGVGKGTGSVVKGDRSVDATVWMVRMDSVSLVPHR